MRLAFIGGNGHHGIRPLMDEAVGGAPPEIAAAGDGYDDAAARRFHAGLGRGAWFDDGRELLDKFKPDLVSLGAVYGHNGDWIAQILQRDIPVISDKPIAATRGQLDTLRRLVRERPTRRIITEFGFRSMQPFRAARDAVRGGLIGPVVLATAQKSYRFSPDGSTVPGVAGARPAWYADRDSYGGTILWVASHAIDVIAFTTGLRYVAAAGRQGNLSKPAYGSMEDHTASLLELEGGVTAIVHADYLRPVRAATHGDDRLRLAGAKGVLEVRDGRCLVATHDAEERDVTGQAAVAPFHQEVLAAVRGQNGELYSTAASLEMAAVLLAARDAADRQTWVAIDRPE